MSEYSEGIVPDSSPFAYLEDRFDLIQAGIDAFDGVPDMIGMMFFLFRAVSARIREHALVQGGEDEFLPFEMAYLKSHPRDMENNLEFYLMEEDAFNYTESLNYIFCNALINDFYQGKACAKDMLSAIFSFYYKDKFKRLKKYKSVTGKILCQDDFIPALPLNATISDIYIHAEDYAVITAMCIVLNIEVSKEIWYLVNAMKDQKERFYNTIEALAREKDEKRLVYMMSEEDKAGKRKICEKAVASMKQYNLKHPFFWPESKKVLKLVNSELSYGCLGFTQFDHHDPKEEMESCISSLYMAGLDLQKMKPEELSAYASFSWYLSLITEQINGRDRLIHDLIYHDERLENDIFQPVVLNIKAQPEPTGKKITITEEVFKKENITIDESSFLEEISALRIRLQNAEYTVQRQRELYEKEKDRRRILEKKTSRFDALQEEVIALREYAYHMAEEDLPKEKETERSEMVRVLNGFRVVLIGGHDNWVNKLKGLFPKWRYASAEEEGSIPVSILDNADMAFFFTGHLGHPQYNRYMDYIRERNIPFAYVSQINIDSNIRQFYAVIKERDANRADFSAH